MAKLTCAVVTPIGPGHQALYDECAKSVKQAFEESGGGFSDLIALRVDDPEGRLGMAQARNLGAEVAENHGADWILFLNADDLLAINAFRDAKTFLENYDAVWGQIFTFENGGTEAVKRIPQIECTDSITDLLAQPPNMLLQTGHFMRTAVARQFLFDETLDDDADLDQALRVWENARCVKLPCAISLKRSGSETTDRDKRTTAEKRVLTRYRIKHGIMEGTAPQLTDYRMETAIFGLIGCGTRELGKAMTVPRQRLILDEPAILGCEWAHHLYEQLRGFGLILAEHEWNRSKYLTFQEFFEVRILPALATLHGWGLRTTRFEGWRDLLAAYPPEQLVLCVRDIRDVILAHVDVALRAGVPIDGAFIEHRTVSSAMALVEMQAEAHKLVRYEELAAVGGLRSVAGQLGLEIDHDVIDRFVVDDGPANRYQLETRPPLIEFVDRVWRQCDEYCRVFGYDRPNAATPEHTLSGAHWHLAPQRVGEATQNG